ncbi:MAG TPA: sigma-54 dependent transcriptional regulator [Pirellulales bacterium]|jgi:two-component system nitrogen regulation response regulator GlnG|nr:sigma-54 dependent transcriptional regulator [Pirellulales bacterium]
MPNVLVIDDDRSVVHLIEKAFSNQSEVEVISASSAADGIERMRQGSIDVVLLDIMLPDLSGLDAYRRLRDLDAKVPVVFITVGGTSDTAIEAMKLGAFDYLLKPLDLARVRELVGQALEMRRLMHVPVRVQSQDPNSANGDSLVGRTTQMQEVYKAIGRVASQNVAVLIRGESGTGKELVARAIYHHSDRASGPFLAVNCAALTETLLESELFGHEKGSFTGATSQRIGKFEQCSGGTLFMDEVGDMSPVMQSKVLRVLQEQKFERVGGTQTIQTDVRIITATNRDLEHMVAHSKFREDLYYRLNGFTIKIPPLRERKEDILLLLDWFLNRFKKDLDKDVHGFSPELLDVLMNYSWPGNVRQLQSVLKQAMVQATGPVLMADLLPSEVRGQTSEATANAGKPGPECDLTTLIQQRLQAGSQSLYAEILEAMERTLLTAVLTHTDGNQSKAAEILGITRGSLRNKIRLLGISIERTVNLEENGAADEPIASEA